MYERPEKILGTVQAGAIAKFHLDRDTLFDTYEVIGSLGTLRQSTCSNLSFEIFYTKITFLNCLIGTKAQLDKVADIY